MLTPPLPALFLNRYSLSQHAPNSTPLHAARHPSRVPFFHLPTGLEEQKWEAAGGVTRQSSGEELRRLQLGSLGLSQGKQAAEVTPPRPPLPPASGVSEVRARLTVKPPQSVFVLLSTFVSTRLVELFHF